MTVNDAIKAFAVIERLHDGTQATSERMARLTQTLLEDPESFWVVFFEAVTADSPFRVKAEALLRSGAIDATTKFSELPGILAVDAMEEKYRRERDVK